MSKRWTAYLADKQQPTMELHGTDRIHALKQNPEEAHYFPRTQRSQHTASRQCPCRPTVRATEHWYTVRVDHFLIGQDLTPQLSQEEWQGLRDAEARRG